MDESSGLQGLVWFLLGELLGSQAPQLLVDDGEEFVGGLQVTPLNGLQYSCYIVSRLARLHGRTLRAPVPVRLSLCGLPKPHNSTSGGATINPSRDRSKAPTTPRNPLMPPRCFGSARASKQQSPFGCPNLATHPRP
jgi:hypothetical protein